MNPFLDPFYNPVLPAVAPLLRSPAVTVLLRVCLFWRRRSMSAQASRTNSLRSSALRFSPPAIYVF